MKKNISINISGIIFHIEEDGYETLRKYLDSISKYFSSFEDSSEIMADIESRIAEIFLSKLNEGKQVITAEDVSTLITTMGSVNDFKAAEEQEFAQGESTAKEERQQYTEHNTSSQQQQTYTPPRRLMRDQQRKIFGGVATGLANYFNVDSVWIRLLFALLACAYGIGIAIYLVMWIIVPGSYELDEPQVDKKMFRDPDHKVLGGVSGGVASYLGIDIVAVRVLFVIFTIVGGLGMVAYIVLWLVLPEAKSLTERMQMQGEPVTLSNIESNIKKNLNVDEKEESTATKILLFPFRLIGMILTGLAKIIGPLVEVLRVAIGILVILFGISFMIATIVMGGVALGLFAMPWNFEYHDMSLPLEPFTRAFPGWVAFAAFLGCLIPNIFVILLGFSIVAKRIVFSAAVGWSMFVLFFVSVALLSVGIPKIIYAFKEDGTHRTETLYTVNGKTALLKVTEVGMDDYDQTILSLKGYEGKDFKLVQVFQAQGSTRQKAIENAQMVDYQVLVEDSVFTFDSNIQFKENAIFRGQRLHMTLYIPYDFPFVMTEDMSRMINQYVDYNYYDGHTWRMTPKGLDCLTCPVAQGDPETQETQSENYDLNEFDEIEISGLFDLRINHGSEYAVEMVGSESEKEKYTITKEGSRIIIHYENDQRFIWNKDGLNAHEMRINITMPDLKNIEAKGAGKITVKKFTTNNLDIDLLGAINLQGEVETHDISIQLSGASEIELDGKSQTMDATVQGASSLRAYNFEVRDAVVEVNGASHAKVNVSGTLEMEEGIASDIDYRGKPNNIIKRD